MKKFIGLVLFALYFTATALAEEASSEIVITLISGSSNQTVEAGQSIEPIVYGFENRCLFLVYLWVQSLRFWIFRAVSFSQDVLHLKTLQSLCLVPACTLFALTIKLRRSAFANLDSAKIPRGLIAAKIFAKRATLWGRFFVQKVELFPSFDVI